MGARLFVASSQLADVAAKLVEKTPKIERFYMVGGVHEGFESWEEAIDSMPSAPVDDQSMGAPMLYSSGTTGKPKGVFVPPRATEFDAPGQLTETLGVAFGFSAETTYLSPALSCRALTTIC